MKVKINEKIEMKIEENKIKEIEKKFNEFFPSYHILNMSEKDEKILISYVNSDWEREKGVCATYDLKNNKIKIINTTINTFDGAKDIKEYKENIRNVKL